jgi:hypothetical protein
LGTFPADAKPAPPGWGRPAPGATLVTAECCGNVFKTILFLAEKSIKYWSTKILQKKRNRERLIFFMYDQSELSVSSFKPKFSQRLSVLH